MRSRLVRLLAVAFGVLGLVATTAPPAQAITFSQVQFVGTAGLSGPLGYPCTPLGTGLPCPPPPPTAHCDLPLNLGVTVLTTNVLTPTPSQCHIDPGGHRRIVTGVGQAVCVNEVVNITKLAKFPVHAGPCFLGIGPPLGEGNHVHGYCGLSGGQVGLLFTDALGQLWSLDIHFNAVGGILILDGHARKLTNRTWPHDGLIVGVSLAIPPTPLTSTESCVTSTATVFTLVATATAVQA